MRLWKELALRWIAEHLPRRIAYYATVRVGAAACVGTPSAYGKQIVAQITVLEALQRWDDR